MCRKSLAQNAAKHQCKGHLLDITEFGTDCFSLFYFLFRPQFEFSSTHSTPLGSQFHQHHHGSRPAWTWTCLVWSAYHCCIHCIEVQFSAAQCSAMQFSVMYSWICWIIFASIFPSYQHYAIMVMHCSGLLPSESCQEGRDQCYQAVLQMAEHPWISPGG